MRSKSMRFDKIFIHGYRSNSGLWLLLGPSVADIRRSREGEGRLVFDRFSFAGRPIGILKRNDKYAKLFGTLSCANADEATPSNKECHQQKDNTSHEYRIIPAQISAFIFHISKRQPQINSMSGYQSVCSSFEICN